MNIAIKTIFDIQFPNIALTAMMEKLCLKHSHERAGIMKNIIQTVHSDIDQNCKRNSAEFPIAGQLVRK